MKIWAGRFLFLTGIILMCIAGRFFMENREKLKEVEETYDLLREKFYDPSLLMPGNPDQQEKNKAGESMARLPADKILVPREAAASRGASPIDWQGLAEWNSRIIGWLEIPGTSLSYPVVQGEDNDFYLNHSLEGEESDYGAIFLGWEHASDFSDACSFIYGHNMLDGAMFAGLNAYTDPQYREQHPWFYIYAGGSTWVYQIFSVQQALVGSESFAYDYVTGTQEYGQHLEFLKQASLYPIEVPVSQEASIAALVTCNTGLEENRRLTVYGLLCGVSLK